MMRLMSCVLHIFFFLFMALTAAGSGQKSSVHFFSLYNPNLAKGQPGGHLRFAVPVSPDDLYEVSASLLMAETWLRTNVLAYYPKARITHIVVGHNVLCFGKHEEKFRLVLPALKNIFYSLTRWGLEREIKVSPSLSPRCLEPQSGDDLGENFVKQLLEFIRDTNSTYLVNPPQPSDENGNLVSAHFEFMRKFGSWNLNEINVVLEGSKEAKPTSRKLSFVDSKAMDPYPERPTPLPEHSPSSSFHITIPAHIAKSPLPPTLGSTSPPPLHLPFAPQPSPVVVPVMPPPFGYHLPPCNPNAPPPVEQEKLWCVAKPSVPPEKLQEALDYACGEGGADCEEIQPLGRCFYPNTVIAHASFALNSYWQKNKRYGGTCSFDGTAMIINADPSFQNCRFKVI